MIDSTLIYEVIIFALIALVLFYYRSRLKD